MQFFPYLQLNGNAREAIGFYSKVFHAGNLGVITYGEMPTSPDFPFPEDAKDLVSHATIRVGESVIPLLEIRMGAIKQESDSYLTGKSLFISSLTYGHVN